MNREATVYCLNCNSKLTAINVDDVMSGKADAFVFVHNDVIHTQADIDAIEESRDDNT